MDEYSFSVKIKVRKNGAFFAGNKLRYEGMDYEDIVVVEGIMLKPIEQLHELGKAKVEQKKKEPGSK